MIWNWSPDGDDVDGTLREDDNELFRTHMRMLAEKATEMEPDVPAWWQLRTIIMFACQREDVPTDFDFRLCEEAMRHDPKNGLYDYLIANEYFRHSTQERELDESDGSSWCQLITDYGLFQKCVEHYRWALAKPLLATGCERASVGAQFFSNSRGSIADKLVFTQWFKQEGRRLRVFSAVAAPVSGAMALHAFDVDLNGMFRLFQRGEEHWIAQSYASGEPFTGLNNRASSLDSFVSQLSSLADAHPGDRRLQKAIDWAHKIFPLTTYERTAHALQFTALQGGPDLESAVEWVSTTRAGLLAAICIESLSVLLLVVSAAAYTVGRILTPVKKVTASRALYGGAIAIWVFACGFVFAIFGCLPAFRRFVDLPRSIENAAGMVVVFLPFALVMYVGGRYVWQQGKRPRAERSWFYHIVRWTLVVLGSLVFIFALLLVVDPKFREWALSPNGFSLDSILVSQRRVYRNLYAGEPTYVRTSIWAIAQWAVHNGLYWSASIGFVALLTANWRTTRKRCNESAMPGTTRRVRWGIAMRQTAKGTAMFAVVLLVLSFAATTEWINALRQQYELEIARLSDPYWLMRQVDTEVKQKVADGLGQPLDDGVKRSDQ